MSANPSTFKITDFRRAVRAAKAEKLDVAGVKIRNGEIEIVVGKPAEAAAPASDAKPAEAAPSDLDRELSDWEARHGNGQA